MSYHAHTKANIKLAAKTLGSKLGRLAIRRQLSVVQIAKLTGSSRTTVYSWFAGKGVTNAYRRPVADLINKLRISSVEQLMSSSPKEEKFITQRPK